jgi:hypothetical protein
MTRNRVAMTLQGFTDTKPCSSARDKMYFVSETAEVFWLKLRECLYEHYTRQ